MDWYYLKDGQPLGPVGEGSIRAWLESGFLRPADLVWRDGLREWTAIWQLPEFSGSEATAAARPSADSPASPPYRDQAAEPVAGESTGAGLGREDEGSRGNWPGAPPPAWQPQPQPGPAVALGPGTRPLVFAGFWLRVGAAMIDWIVLSIVMMLVFRSEFTRVMAMTGELTGLEQWKLAIEALNANRFLVAFSLVTPWLYFAAMESSPWQATLGKKAFRLRVCNLLGERVGPIRATFRHLLKIVLMDLTFALTLVPAAFTRYRQALHDMAAGTLVTRD